MKQTAVRAGASGAEEMAYEARSFLSCGFPVSGVTSAYPRNSQKEAPKMRANGELVEQLLWFPVGAILKIFIFNPYWVCIITEM